MTDSDEHRKLLAEIQALKSLISTHKNTSNFEDLNRKNRSSHHHDPHTHHLKKKHHAHHYTKYGHHAQLYAHSSYGHHGAPGPGHRNTPQFHAVFPLLPMTVPNKHRHFSYNSRHSHFQWVSKRNDTATDDTSPPKCLPSSTVITQNPTTSKKSHIPSSSSAIKSSVAQPSKLSKTDLVKEGSRLKPDKIGVSNITAAPVNVRPRVSLPQAKLTNKGQSKTQKVISRTDTEHSASEFPKSDNTTSTASTAGQPSLKVKPADLSKQIASIEKDINNAKLKLSLKIKSTSQGAIKTKNSTLVKRTMSNPELSKLAEDQSTSSQPAKSLVTIVRSVNSVNRSLDSVIVTKDGKTQESISQVMEEGAQEGSQYSRSAVVPKMLGFHSLESTSTNSYDLPTTLSQEKVLKSQGQSQNPKLKVPTKASEFQTLGTNASDFLPIRNSNNISDDTEKSSKPERTILKNHAKITPTSGFLSLEPKNVSVSESHSKQPNVTSSALDLNKFTREVSRVKSGVNTSLPAKSHMDPGSTKHLPIADNVQCSSLTNKLESKIAKQPTDDPIRAVACVSKFKYVKFSDKFKWFGKGVEKEKYAPFPSGSKKLEDTPKTTSMPIKFGPRKHLSRFRRSSMEDPLQLHLVPRLLLQLENSEALMDAADEAAKKDALAKITLLESQLKAAKEAKTQSSSLQTQESQREQGRSIPLHKLFSSQPRLESKGRPFFNAGADLECENFKVVSPHKLIRKQEAAKRQYVRQRSSFSSRRIPAQDPHNTSKGIAAALIRNKYKVVRQKSTPQYNITRYKMIKKGLPENATRNSPATQESGPQNSFKHRSPRPVVSKKCGHYNTNRYRRQSFGLKKGGKTRRKGKQNDQKTIWNTWYSLRRDNSEDMSVNQLIGRQVDNVSKNRYKFIKGREFIKGRGQKHNTESSQSANKNKYKVDHRTNTSNQARRRLSQTRPRLVLIGGVTYRSNSKTLVKTSARTPLKPKMSGMSNNMVVSLSGVKYRVDAHGKTLRRITTREPRRGSHVWIRRGSQATSSSSATLITASHSLNRSIARAVAASNKTNKSKERQYCLFYNRFGKCNRGDKCPFIHDPDKIAVCARFLRGTCKVTDCPFSHKVSRDKMPVCIHYLRGVCSRENCPYLHVNVGKDAEVCQDFVKGFCPLGEQCKKKHTLICQEWTKMGTCSRGRKCGMKHPTARKRRLTSTSRAEHSPRRPPKQTHKTENSPESSDALPWKMRKFPSFISINNTLDDSTLNSTTMSIETDEKPLKIWPNLSLADDEEI